MHPGPNRARQLAAWCLAAFWTLLPAPAFAQSRGLAEAVRLRDAGRFKEAVHVLEAYLAERPDDARASRLLAQTLYWLGDRTRARDLYEAAVRKHPKDPGIRLDYGRMLLETRDAARLREVIAPLMMNDSTRGQAAALLGTLAYWEGDFTSARRLFRQAVADGAGDAFVQQSLDEIRAMAAPWIRVSSSLWHDDQPLDRQGLQLEGGWFITPLVPVDVRFSPRRYEIDGMTTSVVSGEARIGAYIPSSRVEIEAGGGVTRRSDPEPSSQWTGQAAAGFRLTRGTSVRARLSRDLYFNTSASLTIPVTVTATAGQFRLDLQDWLGEAEVRRQRFSDDNIVRTAYGWLLVPVARYRYGAFQAGYAIGWSDSDESRFVPRLTSVPPFPAPGPIDGRYAPYHTPLRQTSHSIAAAARVWSARGATLRVSGSYGVRAAEDFPFFEAVDSVIRTTIVRRDFTPWTARGSADLPLNRRWTLNIEGETGRGAFYSWTTGGVHLTHHFR